VLITLLIYNILNIINREEYFHGTGISRKKINFIWNTFSQKYIRLLARLCRLLSVFSNTAISRVACYQETAQKIFHFDVMNCTDHNYTNSRTWPISRLSCSRKNSIIFCIIFDGAIYGDSVRLLYLKDIESIDSMVSCCYLRNLFMAMPLNDGYRNFLGIGKIVVFLLISRGAAKVKIEQNRCQICLLQFQDSRRYCSDCCPTENSHLALVSDEEVNLVTPVYSLLQY